MQNLGVGVICPPVMVKVLTLSVENFCCLGVTANLLFSYMPWVQYVSHGQLAYVNMSVCRSQSLCLPCVAGKLRTVIAARLLTAIKLCANVTFKIP
jgi:hypothetical protein